MEKRNLRIKLVLLILMVLTGHDRMVFGRWMACDPAAGNYPSISPYAYVLNSPLIFTDIDGKWVGEVITNDKGELQIVFKAEKGDNIKTLEKQLGLPKDAILAGISKSDKKVLRNPKAGEIITLVNLEVVQNINDYLLDYTFVNKGSNCANAAMAAWGIETIPANEDGGEASVNTATNVIYGSTNVSEENSQIGDIVTYIANYEPWVENAKSTGLYSNWLYDKEHWKGEGAFPTFDEYAKSKYDQQGGFDHFSVVLLKDKTGTSVQQVFEKAGANDNAPQASTYNSQGKGTFRPSGSEKTGRKSGNTPIFRKNP